jgi:hypothetical protein
VEKPQTDATMCVPKQEGTRSDVEKFNTVNVVTFDVRNESLFGAFSERLWHMGGFQNSGQKARLLSMM